MKNSSPLFHNGEFKFSAYAQDNTIRPLFHIHECTKKPQSLYEQYHTPLFLGYTKHHNSVTKDTFSRRINQILQEANRFSSQAVRGASSSYARKHVRIETALNIGK